MTLLDLAALVAAFVLGGLCPSAYEEWREERRKRRDAETNWWDKYRPKGPA